MASNKKFEKALYTLNFRKEYEMRILDKIMILASLPELIKILESSIERMLKIFGIDFGGDA